MPDESVYTHTWDLYASVDNNYSVKVTPYKVEVHMTKVKNEEWKGLTSASLLPEHITKRENTYGYGASAVTNPQDLRPKYPSSNPKQLDWTELDKQIEKEEEEEKPEGNDALQALFKQIYSNGDDATKRAMMKSYQTSGGTVLSTNWKEVAEKNYEKEIEAPKGQEVKRWNE